MNSDNVIQFLHNGFRVGVGATASLIESLQDSEKREENLSDLRLEFDELTKKWADKGEMTEREARNFVDTLIAQQRSPGENPSATTSTTSMAQTTVPISPPTFVNDPTVYRDLQELTAEVAALRAELEILQQKDPES